MLITVIKLLFFFRRHRLWVWKLKQWGKMAVNPEYTVYSQLPGWRTHLIGFSLGAHVSGFVGKETKNLSRITGGDRWTVFWKLTTKIDTVTLTVLSGWAPFQHDVWIFFKYFFNIIYFRFGPCWAPVWRLLPQSAAG